MEKNSIVKKGIALALVTVIGLAGIPSVAYASELDMSAEMSQVHEHDGDCGCESLASDSDAVMYGPQMAPVQTQSTSIQCLFGLLHSWSNWTTVSSRSINIPGYCSYTEIVKSRSCSKCGETETTTDTVKTEHHWLSTGIVNVNGRQYNSYRCAICGAMFKNHATDGN